MNQFNVAKDAYKAGGFQHKVLKLVRLEPLSSAALYEAVEGIGQVLVSVAEFVTDCASVMHQHGYLHFDHGKWSITSLGCGVLNELDMKQRAAEPRLVTVAAKKVYKPDPGTYLGLELQAVVYRKGAYDFLALPSRFGDTLIPHPTAHLAEMGQ